jgi:hypothetical protein
MSCNKNEMEFCANMPQYSWMEFKPWPAVFRIDIYHFPTTQPQLSPTTSA